ncbi:olfactory receptor 52K1 [Xenopus laevis]|uniref:Olfactory receptor 52K1 n=1 Tax=Xenopus laevis TaxID=8355 RepID=A0A8J0U994_XENLA|nr:olfactory receptor 52K1 [Xenopus laevis]
METSSLNQSKSSFSHTQFILLTFPGVSSHRYLLVIPFFSTYVVILYCNSLVIYKIWMEKRLHTPMYSLIALLLLVNIICTTTVLPKMVLVLLGLNQISLVECLVQMFSAISMIMLKSIMLLLMAMDRYVAICKPLRYHNIITKRFLAQLLALGLTRNCLFLLPIVILSSKVQFCKSNVIWHYLCEDITLLSLGCGEAPRLQVFGILVRTIITVCDVSIFIVSYIKVLHTAMQLVVGQARRTALHTCTTHLLVAIPIYSFGLLSSIVNKIEASISYDIRNLFSVFYIFLPAFVNPIIYGFRVKEIKGSLVKPWWKK